MMAQPRLRLYNIGATFFAFLTRVVASVRAMHPKECMVATAVPLRAAVSGAAEAAAAELEVARLSVSDSSSV